MSWIYTVLFAGLIISASDSEKVGASTDNIESRPSANYVQDETEKFQQTYPLNANGRVRISNINGSITVEAWDRSEVQLSYTKTADTKERLSEVEVRIESRPEFLSVESDYDNWKVRNKDEWKNSGRLTVDYRLMVPRGAVLNEVETVNGSVAVSDFTNVIRISAVNGSVKATNLRGTARLSTVNGEVFADFDRLESGSKISLDTVNGKVNLVIPSDSNATLKAESLNGSITNDFGLPVRKGKYVGRDLHGKLGSGDVDIKLNSVNGTLSITKKNDGRTVSPSTNLLPAKDVDDDDWNKVNIDAPFDSAKINKEVEKAVQESMKTAQKELAKTHLKLKEMGPEISRITANSVKLAENNFKMEELAERIANAQKAQQGMLSRIGDMTFFPGMGYIEKKSDSIPVKGVPKVTVEAKGCSVSVRGWDKNEVQYRVTHFSNSQERKPINIKETHSDSAVNLTVVNEHGDSPIRMLPGQNRVRIEIFVPKKTNLKIDASGEIRIEGVSGDVELDGDENSINVRDGDGKLRVSSSDGRVRVIGFSGDVDVNSHSGSINLEGDFRSVNARALDGAVVLTVPDQVSADLDVTGTDLKIDGVDLVKVSGDGGRSKYRVRNGGRQYRIATEGGILVRNSGSLTSETY